MLIELVVVIAMLSVLLISFMPNITSFFSTQQNDECIKILDEITQIAYKDAVKNGHFSVIWGIKGSKNIYYKNKRYSFPYEVFSVKVNRKYQKGLKYYFLIYPDGIMDEVKIEFENNKIVKSSPILLSWQ